MSNDRMEISAIFCCTPKYHCGATVRVAGGCGDVRGVCFDNIFHVRQHTYRHDSVQIG